jgi:hypothetical protein
VIIAENAGPASASVFCVSETTLAGVPETAMLPV